MSELERILSLLRHPLRREIWRRALTSETPISPKDVAVDIGAALGNVSYHAGVLVDAEAIHLVDRVQIRGAMKHFYAPTETFDRCRVLALIDELNAEG